MDMNLSKLGDSEGRGAWHAAFHEVVRLGHDLATERQQYYMFYILILLDFSLFYVLNFL